MYTAAISQKICNFNKIYYHKNRSFNRKRHAFRLHIKITAKVRFWSYRPSCLRRQCTGLTRSLICVESVSPAYLGLVII